MSLVFLTAALGLVTASFGETGQSLAILNSSFFSALVKSWLGFLVLLGLAACSFMVAIANPEQAVIPYG